MDNCVFCRLIKGELPSLVVYEEENVIAILPKEMESFAHTLVIPKSHYCDLYDIPTEILSDITRVCKILTIKYKEKINSTGMNLFLANGKDGQQSVPHFHFHLLPRFKDDNLDTWPKLPKIEFNRNEIFKKVKIS